MSLRRRVLLGCLAVAAVLLVADLVLARTFRSFLLDRVDDELAQAAAAVVGGAGGVPGTMVGGPFDAVGGPFDPPGDGPGGGPGGGPRPFSEYAFGLADTDGNLLVALGGGLGHESGVPQPEAGEIRANITPAGATPQPFTFGPGGWRMVALTRGGQVVLVAAGLEGADATYARLVAILAWATAAVLVTLALVAAWVLRQGIRPLSAMAATAGAIAGGALSQRVTDADPRTEAGRLGHALNAMLARIEEAFAQRAATEARLRRFVADASHELRTPLTSIRGYADLYRQGALTDRAELDGAMRRVESEAARMGALVDDLLLLARLDQGRPLETRPVRLDELAADAVRDALAVEPDRPITLDVRPVTVEGDEARLRQAVGNLLANARVHTPPGTPVSVQVGDADGWAVVEVADSGPGLDPELAPRVFERFVRADTARTRASGGTGLGLAIVAGVVAAHGGEVGVESAPGQGASFHLRLPHRRQA